MAPERWTQFPAGNDEYRAARLRCAKACEIYNSQPEDSNPQRRAELYQAIINSISAVSGPAVSTAQTAQTTQTTQTTHQEASPQHLSRASKNDELDEAQPTGVPTGPTAPSAERTSVLASTRLALAPFDDIQDPGRGKLPDVDPGRLSGKSPSACCASTTAASPATSTATALDCNDSSLSTALSHAPKRFPGQGLAPYIKPPLWVDYGARLKIGTSTFINRNCKILDTPLRTVHIGERCLIGPDFSIYAVTHPLEYELRCGQGDVPSFGGDVFIDDEVWIGGHVTVLGGVRIGKGAVIGAHSLVTKDIPAYTLAYGSPARIIRKVSDHPTADDLAAPRTLWDPRSWVATPSWLSRHIDLSRRRLRVAGHSVPFSDITSLVVPLLCLAVFWLYWVQL